MFPDDQPTKTFLRKPCTGKLNSSKNNLLWNFFGAFTSKSMAKHPTHKPQKLSKNLLPEHFFGTFTSKPLVKPPQNTQTPPPVEGLGPQTICLSCSSDKARKTRSSSMRLRNSGLGRLQICHFEHLVASLSIKKTSVCKDVVKLYEDFVKKMLCKVIPRPSGSA